MLSRLQLNLCIQVNFRLISNISFLLVYFSDSIIISNFCFDILTLWSLLLYGQINIFFYIIIPPDHDNLIALCVNIYAICCGYELKYTDEFVRRASKAVLFHMLDNMKHLLVTKKVKINKVGSVAEQCLI